MESIYISYSVIYTLQYSYLSYGYKFIEDILNWIAQASNIIFEATEGVDEKSVVSKAFSIEFTKACNIAKRRKAPFMCADMFAQQLKKSAEIGNLDEVEFVSITAFYDFIGKTRVDLKEKAVYQLLTGAAFVSFSADTIIKEVERNGYQILDDSIKPFLIYKSDYDMNSFKEVYLWAVSSLSKEHKDAAYQLAKMLLENTKKIWRKGQLYRNYADIDLNSKKRANDIREYAIDMALGIKKMFKEKREITFICNVMISTISYI